MVPIEQALRLVILYRLHVHLWSHRHLATTSENKSCVAFSHIGLIQNTIILVYQAQHLIIYFRNPLLKWVRWNGHSCNATPGNQVLSGFPLIVSIQTNPNHPWLANVFHDMCFRDCDLSVVNENEARILIVLEKDDIDKRRFASSCNALSKNKSI